MDDVYRRKEADNRHKIMSLELQLIDTLKKDTPRYRRSLFAVAITRLLLVLAIWAFILYTAGPHMNFPIIFCFLLAIVIYIALELYLISYRIRKSQHLLHGALEDLERIIRRY